MKREKKGIIYRGISLVVMFAMITVMFGFTRAEAALPKPVVSLSKRTKTTAKITIEKKGTVTGYRIYLKTSKNGKYQLVMGIRNNSYTFKKLKADKTYYVKVRAFRTKGVRITYGKYSKVLTIKPYKKAETTQKDTSSYLQEVLELVNKERATAGLDPLTLDDKLNEAAGVRAQEITKEFSHTRPDGTPVFTILKEYGCSYMAAGENIAAGQSSPAEVVDSWMHSEGHRANILSPNFKKLGVGYCQISSSYKYYWVQLFTD